MEVIKDFDINDFALNEDEKHPSRIKTMAARETTETEEDQPSPVLQPSNFFQLVGTLNRKECNGVLVPVPKGLKKRLEENVTGALSVAIIVLAEMQLAQIEKSKKPIIADVESWEKQLGKEKEFGE